ncbi:hypothetical protein C0995_014027 [Termitomyces sp. Mi166|nr:hypothetical protein C0995_014027 [Termitomyces sp. Mi166\
MPRAWFWAHFALFLAYQTYSYPVEFISSTDISFRTKSERSWLWGWAWGAESTVSVVDHDPVVSFPSRPGSVPYLKAFGLPVIVNSQAAFGAEIHDAILGYVIPESSFTTQCAPTDNFMFPQPNTGCPNLCLSGPNQPTEPWIALVQRGDCEFVKKVREAQRLGAKAVVVGGDDPAVSGNADALVNMYSPEDSSDVKIAATYIKYSDYMLLSSLIDSSNTSHSGLRTLSLLITAEYSAWEWYSPIITFVIILLLPSALTFITLLIHRIRAVRAAQRDRAPEDVVRNLPSHIWTGNAWEKFEGERSATLSSRQPADVEHEGTNLPSTNIIRMKDTKALEPEGNTNNPSTSHLSKKSQDRPWFKMQVECAICLCEFEKGDKIRVLPCHHIFHLDEIDQWLIQRKKLLLVLLTPRCDPDCPPIALTCLYPYEPIRSRVLVCESSNAVRL